MKRVLIISISLAEQRELEGAAQLFASAEFTFNTTSSFGQEAAWWLSAGPEALVLALPPDEELQTYYLAKMQEDVPRTLPIVLLSPIITSGLMGLSQTFECLRIVKMPAPGTTIFKMLVELTTDFGPNKRQHHPRYLTDQLILISDEVRGLSFQATMKNLSVSGAYFEAGPGAQPDGANLKEQDIIKLNIEIGSPTRGYAFDGRVVWTKPLANGNSGYGIAFIDKEEVYNNLLKGF